MKLLTLSCFLLSMSLLFTDCKDSIADSGSSGLLNKSFDNGPCGRTNWLGTYDGTISCDGAEAESVTVTIEAGGQGDEISISSPSGDQSFKIDDCGATAYDEEGDGSGGIDVPATNVLLSGDQIIIESTQEVDGQRVACQTILSRN